MIKTMPFYGVPGDTIRLASTDVSTALAAGVLTNAGRAMQGMIITVDSNSVRIAFNDIAPTQGATGVGHTILKDQAPVVIMGADLCSTMHYISAANGSSGGLQITPLYSN